MSAAVLLPAFVLASAAPSALASSSLTVATGVITGSHGTAMPGVAVVLYAWPLDSALSAMKSGQTVPMTRLGSTTTSSAGSYRLQIPQATLRAVTPASGYANLEVYTAVGMRFFSYHASSSAGRLAAPTTASFTSSTKLPKYACGYDKFKQPYTFSGWKLERRRAQAWAVVGQGYIVRRKHTSGDRMSFKYAQGSSHTQASSLGVAISGHGFDAGYTSSGSSSSSATASVGFGRQNKNSLFLTQFKTGQFRGMCYNDHAGTPHLHQAGQCPKRFDSGYVHKCLWMIRSMGWFGGAKVEHPSSSPRTPRGDCALQDKNTNFQTDRGVAIKWTRGWDLGAALGIKGVNLKADYNGSAQTGYDSDAFMNFNFAQRGYLCGTNASPSTAAVLVQRDNKP
ncbi:MAG TPA: hypothetical protein VGG25_15815 [Streptosporangiaceae bacterium]